MSIMSNIQWFSVLERPIPNGFYLVKVDGKVIAVFNNRGKVTSLEAPGKIVKGITEWADYKDLSCKP